MSPHDPKKPDFSDVRGGASSSAQSRPAARAPNTYTVVKGDSLSRIAKSQYGNASLWKIIYEANKQVIGSNPDLIQPGQVLTIPEQGGV